MGGNRINGTIVRYWRVRFRSVAELWEAGDASGVEMLDLGVRFPIGASIDEIGVELCRVIGRRSSDVCLWRGTEQLHGSVPAADLPNGAVIEVLDNTIARRESALISGGGDGGGDAGARVDTYLDVIHGPMAGRSVVLSASSLDLAPFLGPGAGSMAHRDHAVIWNTGGLTTLLEVGVPYRIGTGLAIVRSWSPVEGDSEGVVHRLPLFERQVGERVLGPVRPPEVADAGRHLSTVAVAVPLVAGVVGALAFGRPEFLIISAMAPIASLATWSGDRTRSRRHAQAERERFDSELAQVMTDGAAIGAELSRDEHDREPDTAVLYRRVLAGDGRLWDRDVSQVLSVRIGTAPGRIPLLVGVEPAGSGVERDADEAIAQLRQRVERAGDLPVCVELDLGHHDVKDAGGGRVGNTGGGRVGNTGGGRVGNTAGGRVGNTAGGLALVGPDPLVGDVARAVIAQLACHHPPSQLRLDVPDDLRLHAARWLPHVRHSHAGASDDASSRRVRVAVDSPADPMTQQRPVEPTIWLTSDPRRVPRWCDTVVTLSDDGPGIHGTSAIVRTRSGDRLIEPDRLGPERFDDVARAMSRLREPGVYADRGDGGLLDVLGVSDASAMGRVWSDSDASTADSLLVTLGVGQHGPVGFDLVADGPHALIAGTTGSGKSMLLQTLLLSLATAHPPARVQFLGIDFKGGSTFDPLRRLPHCAGVVTNLEGGLAERVLVSLRAELERRMRLLSGRAADLAALRAIDPDSAPAALVIVIDEFAALVREAPGFLDAMVDLAQRGRSLGLHLILATQRPTGAVNDAILANTNIRIAMRCADGAESVAIIGDRRAADLVRPGRGLVKVGAMEPEPFSVPDGERREGAVVAITIWPLGTPEPVVGASDTANIAAAGVSDRQRLVNIIDDAAVGRARGTRPWLDPLPDDLASDQLEAMAVGAAGVIDRPERQDAIVLAPPVTGLLLICGARGSGRSNAVAAAVRARKAEGPRIGRVTVVDWAGRSPVPDMVEPDVVVGPAHLEPLVRLIQLLDVRVERHRRSAAVDDEPAGVEIVAVDEIAQLVDDLLSIDHGHWVAVLSRVMREASASGVLFVVSALRARDLPGVLQPAVTASWQLRPSHVDDVSGLALPGADAACLLGSTARLAATSSMLPGRALIDGHWAQIAHLGRGPGGAAGASGRGTWPGPPGLPDCWRLGSSDLAASTGLVVGLCDLTLGPLTVDPVGHVAVVGPHGSGRTNALEVLAAQWPTGRRWLLARADSRLHGLGGWEQQIALGDPDLVAKLRDGVDDTATNLLVVDDVDDVPEPVMAALDAVIGTRGVTVMVSGSAPRFERSYGGWLSEVKRSGRCMMLQPDRAADVESLTGRRIRLRPDQPMVPGRGVWVDRRTTMLVQMPLAPGLV